MFLGRKFFLFLFCVIILSVALLTGKATGTEFTTGVCALYGLFVVGNVSTKVIKKCSEHEEP